MNAGIRKVLHCLVIYILTVAALVSALYLSVFLPQDMITKNARSSAEMLIEEGAYPKSGDHSVSTTLDNWTDALMLNLSAAMNSEDLQSVWTNSYYGKAGAETTAESLYAYLNGDEDISKGDYPRYWMGFRATLRLALAVFNLAQLRRVISLAFFCLLMLAAASVAKHLNMKMAFSFVLSVLFVKPQVISGSLQFTACFFIALPAMLLVPLLARKAQWQAPFFMLLGMLTMYFDFYTYPLICLGFPLVYLYLVRREKGNGMSLLQVLACCGIWFFSYLIMWLTKLFLSSLFSSADSFGSAVSAVQGWLQPDKAAGAQVTVLQMFDKLRWSIFPDGTWMAVAAMAVFAVLIYLLVLKHKGGYDFGQLVKYPALLLIALLPVLWFCVAAKPTYVHAWFQYRSIAVSYWALFALVSTGFCVNKAD